MKSLVFLNFEMDLAGLSVEHKVGSAIVFEIFFKKCSKSRPPAVNVFQKSSKKSKIGVLYEYSGRILLNLVAVYFFRTKNLGR